MDPQEYDKRIFSPQEASASDMFTDEEKSAIPDTHLRFVIYTHEKFYECKRRGQMLLSSITATAATPASGDPKSEQTVAGATCMMANIYHEALCLLRGLKDGYISLNGFTEAIRLTQGTDAIALSLIHI